MEEKCPRARENIFLMKTEESYLAYDPEEGDKWELNETGAFILKNLMNNISIVEIKEKIMKLYDIDSEKAERSLEKYLIQLREEGIIE